jgi:hypothetical protein
MKLRHALQTCGLGLLTLAVVSCGKQSDVGSTVKVSNGIEIPETEYPSVVLLYDKDAGSICTGTFVTENAVLTAAHCTMGGDVNDSGDVDLTLNIIEIEAQDERKAKLVAESVRVVRNPEWDRNGRNVNRYDLGLVFFESGVARDVSEIAEVPAQEGDDFTIVGYGLNGNDKETAGIKRMGNNTVSSISGGFIRFTGQSGPTDGEGTDSAAGSGDSGGPLFIDTQVAGVTSGGGWGGWGRTRSLYIDLHSSTSVQFLQQYVRY